MSLQTIDQMIDNEILTGLFGVTSIEEKKEQQDLADDKMKAMCDDDNFNQVENIGENV